MAKERRKQIVLESEQDAAIAHAEAQGWQLLKQKPYGSGQMELEFAPAALPDFTKTGKSTPLRRRLRNYVVVGLAPLGLMCCIMLYVLFFVQGPQQDQAAAAMQQFMQASMNGNDATAADEACTDLRISVEFSSPSPPANVNVGISIGKVELDGATGGVQVILTGDHTLDDNFMVIRENGAWHVCDPRLRNGIWGLLASQ